MDDSYEKTYKSIKKANKWVIYVFISLLITAVCTLFKDVRAIGGKDIKTITGVDITTAVKSQESNTMLSKVTSTYSQYGVKVLEDDYYITQYQDSKFKKTSAKDDNKSDNSFIYFYDDKGKVIFTIVNANLLKDYYYLVPGEFESYTGLQLYKKVE